MLLYDDLKDKKHPSVDSNFKSFENNDESNTSKFVKPLFEKKSNKKELSHSKAAENIKTKEFEMFPATKFREPIDSFIDRLVEGQETKISECEKDLDAKTALKLEFESLYLPVVLCIVLAGTLVIGLNLLNAFIRMCIANLHSAITLEWLTSLVY